MSIRQLSLGIDFGTNAVRALVLDPHTGQEIATASCAYPSGEQGVLLDSAQPHLARQNPADYYSSMENAVGGALQKAGNTGIDNFNIVGIGVDTTGSTPLPVDRKMVPLGIKKEFENNLNAQAWLWKDHTSSAEATEISALASEIRPQYLKKCGGAYSSEWFFSKIFHCLRIDKNIFDAAYSWIELSDFIPALISGIEDIAHVKRNICAAGHKAMFNVAWGGLPDKEFLANLDPELELLSGRLYNEAFAVDELAGYLCDEWAGRFGLPAGIPVAVGALDAHIGAIGSGVGQGTLVKIIGTSTCDIMVQPISDAGMDIPGVAGIVPESVLPGYRGIEAGQSAVGDIFNWYVARVLNGDESSHQNLTKQAAKLKAGQSGLLALDWNNGNRNILTDPNLSGLLLGQTLLSKDYEIYRALIEATAFGALRIIEQIEQSGVKIERVVNCGGITQKNELLMQVYADVLGRPMAVAQSSETVALGAAIIGAFAALNGQPGFKNIEEIQKRICRVNEKIFIPNPDEQHIYKELYVMYQKLHDAFGMKDQHIGLYSIMKDLIRIKTAVIRNDKSGD